LTFDSFAGKTYRIQYKNDLGDSTWTTPGADIIANSSSTTVSDNMGGAARRFYRIVQVN
jgi:hypothetical protein